MDKEDMGLQRWMWGSQESSKNRPGRPSIHGSNASKQKAYRMRLKEKAKGPWKRRPWTLAERQARYKIKNLGHIALKAPPRHRKLQKNMTASEMAAFKRAHRF